MQVHLLLPDMNIKLHLPLPSRSLLQSTSLWGYVRFLEGKWKCNWDVDDLLHSLSFVYMPVWVTRFAFHFFKNWPSLKFVYYSSLETTPQGLSSLDLPEGLCRSYTWTYNYMHLLLVAVQNSFVAMYNVTYSPDSFC